MSSSRKFLLPGKMRDLLLVASLAANLGLGYLVLREADVRPAPMPVAAGARGPGPAQPPATPATARAPAENASTPVTPPEDPLLGDYRAWVQDLEARDVPPATIRQLVFAALQQDYADLAKRAHPAQPYWKQPQRTPGDEILETLAYEEEQRQLLRALFGDEVEGDPLFASLFTPLGEGFAFLDSARQIALHDLIEHRRAGGTDFQGPLFMRERMADRQEANAELLASIQALLTPDEFLEYQLRDSRLADSMRRSMEGFDYTEQEFRDIFQLRQEARTGMPAPSSGGWGQVSREDVQRLREETEDRVRDYLGDSRYQELQKTQDPLWRTLQSIGTRYSNSPSQVEDVYRVTSSFRDEIDAIRGDAALSPQERRSSLQKLNEELPGRLEAVVGRESAQSIQQNVGRLLFAPRFRARGN